MAEIEELKIVVDADAEGAIKALNQLKNVMNTLRAYAGANAQALDKTAKSLNSFASSTQKGVKNITRIADAVRSLNEQLKTLRQNSDVLKTVGTDAKVAPVKEAPVMPAQTTEVTLDSAKMADVVTKSEEVKTTVETATQSVKGLKEELEGVGKSTSSVKKASNDLKQLGNSAKQAGSKAKSGASGLAKFGQQIKNIIKYRIVRRILSEIGTAMKEGLTNLYNYSKAMGSMDSLGTQKALDSWASLWLTVKNTLGVTMMSAITAIMPLVKQLADLLIQAANAANMFFAAISGKGTYTRAVETATSWAKETKSAAKEVQKTILGFDEINQLQDNKGGGGGSNEPDASKMFEEVEIPKATLEMVEKIKEIFKEIKGHLDKIFGHLKNIFNSPIFQKLITGAIELALSAVEAALELVENVLDTIEAFASGDVEGGFRHLGETIADLALSVEDLTVAKPLDWLGELLGQDWDFSGLISDLKEVIDVWADGGDWATKWNEVLDKMMNGDYGTLVQDASTAAYNIGEAIKAFNDSDLLKGFDKLEEAKDHIWNIAEAIGDILGIRDVVDSFKEFVDIDFTNVGKLFTGIGDAVEKFKSGDFIGGITTFTDSIKEWGKSSLNGENGGFLQWFAQIGDDVGTNLASYIDNAKDNFNNFNDWFKDTWGVDLKKIIKGVFNKIATFAKNPIGTIENKFNELLGWFDTTFGTDLKSKFDGFKKFIKDPMGEAKTWVQGKFTALKGWFKDTFGVDIDKVFTDVKVYIQTKLGDAKTFVLDKFKDLKNWFKNTFGVDIDKIFQDIKTFIENPFETAYTTAKNKFDELKKWFENTCIPNIKKAFDTLPSGVKKAMYGAWNAVAKTINTFINGAMSVINFVAAGLATARGEGFKPMSAKYTIPTIEGYATGGFPQAGEIFVGNEQGIEMMGRMGNQNVVANNQQIVDGIKRGVFEAMASVMSQNRQPQTIENVFQVDSETLYRAVRRGEQKYNGRYTTAMVF